MTKLSEELTWRGFINQTTFADISAIDEPRTFYFGVDPSADSMQIGNLAAAMLVRHFIDHGNKAILLVGGATGMIGDPDGKKQEREVKNADTVNANAAKLAAQFRHIFNDQDFQLVNNADWFAGMNYVEFLHDIGKHVSMTQMLDREFVQSRIGEGGAGISYAEFSYSLIQGYDFLYLFREHGATLQLAGADQWGNSVMGASLIRKLEGGEANVLSMPLIINKQTGVKFGKSEGGAVWLDPAKTSPYKFYQFWLNVDDETAEDLIKIYTLLDREAIENLITRHRENPGARELQKTLAYEVTTLVHGEYKTASIQKATEMLFDNSKLNTLSTLLTSKEFLGEVLDNLEAEIPTIHIDNPTLEAALEKLNNDGGISVDYALVKSGIVPSYSQARRLLASNAISVNGMKVTENISVKAPAIVKKGKNSFILVR